MHADAIRIINDIEERCDTHKLLYRGVSYWPLCRLRLWTALMCTLVLAKKAGDPASIANTPPSLPNAGQVNAEFFGPQSLGLLRTHPNGRDDPLDSGNRTPQALFFARPEEYSDKIHGKAFAKTIDSVFENALTDYSATKLEMADPKAMGFDRHYPSLFLHLEHASHGVIFEPPGKLEHFPLLETALEQSGTGLHLNPAELTADMGKIFYYARIFEKTLRLMGPRAFFLSVYYHNIGMAWMLACSWAGVTSVDLQHGRLGPHHGAYTHLSAAPAEGYHLMPDVIWCWGDQTKHDIEVAKNEACTRHGGIVGGNAWLHKWRYGNTEGLEPPEAAKFASEISPRKKILVSLQPLESPINATLLQAMQQSPPDWLWLIRLHPLRRHTAPEISAILNNAGVSNFEIQHSTTLPLFSLLKIVDHHVTVFSSVVIEAAAFGVRTSLIGEEGRDIFKAQIEQGICRYTTKGVDLLDHVKEAALISQLTTTDDFMDMSEYLVTETLESIL